ncbi:MAG: hypothetical protein ACRETT_09805 [Steroidobacteraceae bacterium]
MPHFLLTSALLLLAGTLAGCQHRQTIAYPKVGDAGPLEAAFDCAALDDAILKGDAVRWVMRQDGARLLTRDERVARTVASVGTGVAAGALCPLCFSPVNLGDEGHAALDRADRRLLSLLDLKKKKACDARPTAIPQMTDLDLLDAVVALPKTPVGELHAARTRLLDRLRP